MSAYVIVDINVHEPVEYEEYRRTAAPTLTPYGGRYIVRGGATRVLEGAWTPHRLVVLAFPSMERALAWWDSPEYRPVRAIRQRTTATSMILVEGIGE